MKIKSTISYPINEPTINGNIYNKEALYDAFQNKAFVEMNESKEIPVHYMSGTYQSEPIGFATAKLLDNGKVEVEAQIFDKVLSESLSTYDGLKDVGIILAGKCSKTYKGILSNIKYREALLTLHPAMHCSMEIIEQ